MPAAVVVESLSKRYRKGVTGYRTLREDLYNLTGKLVHLRKHRDWEKDARYIWALRDIDFRVEPGEKLGIIGRNGSGKTTLLRLLAGITKPTEGKISVNGRLGVIIELMAGFHPELTGRENIFLNGAVMGMSQKEIRRKFDEIVAFAELEEFIDTPIKRYSSGMHVRLGFAIAAHLDPDVLLVDEVLAVGDAAFQRKCLGKMDGVAGEGRTVVFVSHNLGSVRRLCTRGIALSNGQVIFDGASSDAVDAYMSAMPGTGTRCVVFEDDPSKPIVIRRVAVVSPGKEEAEALDMLDLLIVELEYNVKQEMRGTNIAFSLSRDGFVLFRSWDTDSQPVLLEKRTPGDYVVRIELPQRLLTPGVYTVSIGVGRPGVGLILGLPDCISFELHNLSEDLSHTSHSRGGAFVVPIVWETILVNTVRRFS